MIKFEDIMKIFRKKETKTKDEDLTCKFQSRLGMLTVKFGSKELYDQIKKNSKNDKFSPWIFN